MEGGCTPLYMASQTGHDQVVTLVLAAGCDMDKADHDVDTPFYAACQWGHETAARMLL